MFSLSNRSRYALAWRGHQLDRGVVLGISAALLLICCAVLLGGHAFRFFDLPSVLIVVGGACCATTANFAFYDLRLTWRAFKEILTQKAYHPIERMQYLVGVAQVVKRNGLLVLEQEAARSDDPFLKLALQVALDGQNLEDNRRILETEMRTAYDRGMRAVQVLETLATYAPAMGLIGTLIGLIQMLAVLNDPSQIGAAMATALVATFYGAILANLVFLPLAGRIRNRNEEEAMVKALTLEGTLSISRQESPVIVEQKLQGFLPMARNG